MVLKRKCTGAVLLKIIPKYFEGFTVGISDEILTELSANFLCLFS